MPTGYEVEQVRHTINSLGCMSPDDIATMFYQDGIKGILGHAQGCAVNLWLSRRFPRMIFRTHRAYIGICPASFTTGYFATIPNPLSIQEFIKKFDNFKYPSLVDQLNSPRPCTCPSCQGVPSGQTSKYIWDSIPKGQSLLIAIMSPQEIAEFYGYSEELINKVVGKLSGNSAIGTIEPTSREMVAVSDNDTVSDSGSMVSDDVSDKVLVGV